MRTKRVYCLTRSLAVLLICVFVCVFFTSCNGPFTDPKSLMEPPKASGELTGIEDALTDSITGSYTFIYPSSGNYRSAFTTADINADGKNEAVVFYQLSETNEIHLNFFMKSDEKWKSALDMKINGTGIDSIDFADLYGDKALELLIGCNLYNNEKRLYVYSVNNSDFTELCQESYSNFSVCSLYKSDKPQIMVFSIGSDTSQNVDDSNQITIKKFASAKLLSLEKNQNGGSSVISKVSLDRNITSVSSIVQAKINDKVQGLYVDAYKGSSIMITELLYFDSKKNQLIDEFYNNGDNTTTRREALVNSRDMNGDGQIEMPLSEIVPGYENSNFDERLYYTQWRQYDGTNFIMIEKGFYNAAERYFIRLPEKWFTNVKVDLDIKNSSEKFSVAKKTASDGRIDLAEIKVFTKSEFAQRKDGFISVSEKNGRVYAAKIYSTNNEYSIDTNYITQNLIVF